MIKIFKTILISYHLILKFNGLLSMAYALTLVFLIIGLGVFDKTDLSLLFVLFVLFNLPLIIVLGIMWYKNPYYEFKPLFKYHFFTEKKYTIRSLAFDVALFFDLALVFFAGIM